MWKNGTGVWRWLVGVLGSLTAATALATVGWLHSTDVKQWEALQKTRVESQNHSVTPGHAVLLERVEAITASLNSCVRMQRDMGKAQMEMGGDLKVLLERTKPD